MAVRTDEFLRSLAASFWSEARLDLNYRRMEHLAWMGLGLEKRSVLEVGGGIGDLSMFFVDRGCRVLLTDARPELVRHAAGDEQLRGEARLRTRVLDLDSPGSSVTETFDVVVCYDVLHLLARPERALKFLAGRCGEMLLLDCEISPGEGAELHAGARPAEAPTGSVGGRGCRPTRGWLTEQLAARFRFVYEPEEQPAHGAYRVGERLVLVGAHRKLAGRVRPVK